MNGHPGKRLLIAGGGTGGHLFPAMAIAEAWESMAGEVLFVGTPRGLESRIIPQRGKKLALIPVGQYKGGGLIGKLRTLLGLPMALLRAVKIVRSFKPDIVLGVGGYASAPAVAAARLLGIPTALHEQNALPGLTNRLLSRIAKRIFISFAEAGAYLPVSRTRLTGNPVNHRFHQMAIKPLPKPEEPFRILIFGGSLGARIFSEIVPSALVRLRAAGFDFQVQQQVQEAQLQAVTDFYNQQGITAEIAPFFEDMVQAYQLADLVICRAGATTVSELAALGKPALLIPYPFAADDHQTANARAFAETGAGWMQRQEKMSSEWLSDFLFKRLSNPEELRLTAQQARNRAHPQAASDIVNGLLSLTKQ
ncbi:MAG: undecaprenyldiphospho-muramoylpentapeptide beta-N-acetylglucosaminyltransferase [Magnetococcales bacterium]|nr:undecaprenyldiphospho-muramoylpentapeptide beta-N-acetylglucosaminyltransferase [Magnetococcales bacterium]